MRSAALRASFLCQDLLRSEDERSFFLCQQCEGVYKTSKVLNEDSDYADGAKEGLHFREVFAWTPVDDFVDS